MNGMKLTLYNCYCFVLCLLIGCSFLALPWTATAAEQSKTVRIGWYEDAYNITGKHGERSGYAYEFEQAVAAYTGWQYEYVKGGWSDLLAMVARGELDMMAGISYTDERAQKMLFSELPMGQEKYYLYADLANTDISASNLDTLDGKRICLLENSIQATQFYAWEKAHHVKLKYVYANSFDYGKKLADNHEIDAVISTETPAWVKRGMSAIATTGGSGIYFAINKNRPDLKRELDDAMRKMEYDKPFYADELYKRYLSASSVAVLSKEEKAWLSQHGAIRLGYLKNDIGFSNIDSSTGKLTGVINDYIKLATDSLGEILKFNLVGFDSQQEQLQALKDKKIDMILHVSQAPYFAEQNGLILSSSVLAVTPPAVTAKDFFDEAAENTIAIEKDNLILKWYISYNYPQWNILECATTDEVEAAVRTGKADCFITKYRQLTKYIEDKTLHTVFLTRPGNTAFAVNRQDTMLISILNKSLKSIPATTLTGTLAMYDNTLRKVTTIDFVKDNVVAVALMLVTFFLIILLTILGFLRKSKIAEAKAKQAAAHVLELNQRLEESHHRLQENHKELEKALQRAESASSAKTNFLFNMSHDIRTPMNALLGYTKLMKSKLTDPELISYQEKMEQSGNLLLSILNNVLDMSRIESGKVELDESYSQVGNILHEICEVFDVEAKKKGLHLTVSSQVQHEHIMCDITKIKEIFTNLVSNAVKYTPSGGSITITSTELPCDKPGFVRIQTEVTDTGIGMSKDFLPLLFESFSRERNTTIAKVAGTGLGMAIVKKLVDMMDGTITVDSQLGKGSKFTVILEHRLADEAYYKQQEQTEAAAPISLSKESLKGKHILLAEDNDLNAEIAMVILRRMGLIVERVDDGVQCVNKVDEQPAGTYDLILMDIQMPHLDGYKATQAIRSFADQAKAAIPIVAMTANAFEEDKHNAFKAGMNGHIAKPIDIDKVEKVLLSILH